MIKYHFRQNKNYLGELILENDKKALEMAKRLDATFVQNMEKTVAWSKCSKCGEWDKVGRMKGGLCGDCNYAQEIEFFVEHMEKSMERALEEDKQGNEELYHQIMNEPIRISYNGASIELVTGPCEWETIIDCLLDIAKESPW